MGVKFSGGFAERGLKSFTVTFTINVPPNSWWSYPTDLAFRDRNGAPVPVDALYDNSADSRASYWFDSYDGTANQTRTGATYPTNGAQYETGVAFAPSVWFDSYDGTANQTRTGATYAASAVQAN